MPAVARAHGYDLGSPPHLRSRIDSDHVRADLKDGVLTLVVPKRPERQPRKISLGGRGDKDKAKA